jgi:hypothetical protein
MTGEKRYEYIRRRLHQGIKSNRIKLYPKSKLDSKLYLRRREATENVGDMTRQRRILIYILLTTLFEGSLVYGIFTLSNGIDLNDTTNLRYVARQYCYYVAYNIGYVLFFTYGLVDFYILSGMMALAIGCIGMFFAIFLIGEIIVRTRAHLQPA